MRLRATLAALLLAASACGGAHRHYPLPRAVGQTHHALETREAQAQGALAIQCNVPAEPDSPPTVQLRRAEAIGDPEVLAILYAAHDRAIGQAKLAQKKAADPAVRRFASAMVADHGQAMDRDVRVAQNLDIESWATHRSKRMRQDTKQKLEQLKNLAGADFDKQYVDNAVKEHMEVLAVIDSKLLPNVRSLELKARLEGNKATASHHLVEARDLQRHLDSPAAPR
jgi:putative membrane protein